MSPSVDMQARTVVEYALDNCTRAHLLRFVPAAEGFTRDQWEQLEALASAGRDGMRQAVELAHQLLEGANS